MSRGLQITPVSRLWLVQFRLGLRFLQPISGAMGFSPALAQMKLMGTG